MKHITKKQLRLLEPEAKEIITALSDKKSTDEILAYIYESGIAEATHLQGMTAAARVIFEVKSFDLDLSVAAENSDVWLDQLFWRLAWGMNLKERCNLWAAVANAGLVIILKGEGNEEEAERAVKEALDANPDLENISADLEERLKSLAKKAIRKSGLMLSVLSEQIDSLEVIDNANDEAKLLLYYADREVEFRAVAAMLAYVKIKNGAFKNISEEITLPQTAALVCAAIERVRINVAVGRGKLPKERAAEILTFLGMYVLGAFLVKLAVSGFEAFLPYLGIVRSATGVIAAILPLLYLLAIVYDKAEEACRRFLNFACAAFGDAVRGAKEMFKFMSKKEDSLPVEEAVSDIHELKMYEKNSEKEDK